jgi:hypothetical protein
MTEISTYVLHTMIMRQIEVQYHHPRPGSFASVFTRFFLHVRDAEDFNARNTLFSAYRHARRQLHASSGHPVKWDSLGARIIIIIIIIIITWASYQGWNRTARDVGPKSADVVALRSVYSDSPNVPRLLSRFLISMSTTTRGADHIRAPCVREWTWKLGEKFADNPTDGVTCCAPLTGNVCKVQSWISRTNMCSPTKAYACNVRRDVRKYQSETAASSSL